MKRMVIVTVDTLVEILKDYLGEEEMPGDARVETLLVKPNEKGKFAIRVASERFEQDQAAMVVDFDIKRVYSV